MSTWNFDISQAPKGGLTEARFLRGPKGKERLVQDYHAPRIIAAGNGGVVTSSKWLPDAGRWEMFTKDAPPIAWQPWPEHPHAQAIPIPSPFPDITETEA